jgi:diguanylate cyclase (GGDEF)-like protein/PAS domain S-box-containing protein
MNPGPANLTTCESEPIHVPGHIQPHGVLIATTPGGKHISHISQNAADLLGSPPEGLLGSDLAQLVGPAAFAAMEQTLRDESYAPSNVLNLVLPFPVWPRQKVLVHRSQERTIVEFEHAGLHDEAAAAMSRTQSIIASMRKADTVAQLCEAAVREVRRLTHYDRVMIYRFDEAGNGSVIAEDKLDGLAPYLHLHYPASDIPQQARRLYVSQRVRAIPDAAYRPVPVLSADGSDLDMTFCALRGISPIHLEYMQNMGVRASLTVSLLKDDALWGMIVCHHRRPLPTSPELRALCDVIGQLMSVLLLRVAETENLAARLGCNSTIILLRKEIEAAGSVPEGLCRHSDAVLDLMDAGGALIRCGGETRRIGRTPPRDDSCAMVDALLSMHGEALVGTADAGTPGGVAAAFSPLASGILVTPIATSPGEVIAWFRPEVAATVLWAGDPHKAVLQEPSSQRLTPRKSFAAWTELVRGRSLPWSAVNLQAAEDLRRAITQALLHQTTSQLARLSAYDPLTGLANRRTVEAELKRWQLVGVPDVAALLFMDLDRFKNVNDSFGHEAGDGFLVEVAARLLRLAPSGSLAGRLGGDEFVLFMPGAQREEATLLADDLVAALARPFTLGDQLHYSGVSIGVACGDVASFESLIGRADAAMYAAKRQGGGQAVFFEPGPQSLALAGVRIQQELFRTVEAHGLEVHYQPLVDVRERRISGFEALVRWNHPDRGWVPPSEFIPRAEDAGLISRIGLWVLGVAAQQIAAWRQSHAGLTMSVNVSALQLADGSLVKELPAILAAARLPAAALCIEVTESTLMEAPAVRSLEALRRLGLKVSVDDFGTGHSSLSYLRALPVETVKIDRSFVTPLGSVKADRFFTAIVDLARTIDLRTVAEGCETLEQWRIIEAAGCDTVQGWLFAPAMSPAAAERFLNEGLVWPSGLDPIRSLHRSNPIVIREQPDFLGNEDHVMIDGVGLSGRDVFFAAVQMSRVAMTLVDPNLPDSPIVFANAAFEQLTGYDNTEIIGRNCRFLQGAESDPGAVARIHNALAAKTDVSVQLINYRKDGTSFCNAVRIVPVFDASQKLVYFFGSQIDVTRRNWL